MPLFAICRGFQEMNVAYGGTLWQKVQEVPGLADHRENKEDPLEVQYAPAHEVELRAGRRAARASRARTASMVNSLHSQGVQRLGDGLEVEARAPDGLVEGFRVRGAPRFRARGAVAPRVAGDEATHFRARCSPPSARRHGRTAKDEDHEHAHSAILQGTRHLGGRGRGAGHGRHRARQGDAGDEVRGGGGHAHAREHLPADRHRRLPGGRPRHQPVRDRHRAARRPEPRRASCPGPPSPPRR